MIGIQKEKHNYLAMLVAEDAITQEQCSNLSLHNGGNYLHSDFLASSKVDCINWGWSAWLKAKAQAIPDGFVLVPKELPEATKQKIMRVFHESDKFLNCNNIYKAMIEAQELAND